MTCSDCQMLESRLHSALSDLERVEGERDEAVRARDLIAKYGENQITTERDGLRAKLSEALKEAERLRGERDHEQRAKETVADVTKGVIERLRARLAQAEEALRLADEMAVHLGQHVSNSRLLAATLAADGNRKGSRLTEAEVVEADKALDAYSEARALSSTPPPSPSTKPEYWLIRYEDASVSDEIFTDEVAARARYAERLTNWNCHLFASVEVYHGLGGMPSPSTTEEPMRVLAAHRPVEAGLLTICACGNDWPCAPGDTSHEPKEEA